MARSDLLVSLVQAGASGDQQRLCTAVEAIIAEEKAKRHTVLADRLARALNGHSKSQNRTVPTDVNPRYSGTPAKRFIREVNPRVQLGELFLSDACAAVCEQLIVQQHRADLLRSYGLEPQHRVLLTGPPGNGKTSLAEALALPMFVIRYDAIIGHYLGETAARLRNVFEYARTTQCLLFFDEFDAIAKERGDTNETGEIKRVVTALLMQMDDLPSYTMIVAASNHAELLDRAVWRRFQVRLELPNPQQTEILAYLKQFFGRFDAPTNALVKSLARKFSGVSYAEIEEFCQGVLRGHALAGGTEPLAQTVEVQLSLWSTRAQQVTNGFDRNLHG